MCIKWYAKCQTHLPYVCILLAVWKETVLWILLAVRKEDVLWILLAVWKETVLWVLL